VPLEPNGIDPDAASPATAPASEGHASPSSTPPAAGEAPGDAGGEPKEAKRKRFESRLPGLIRRGIEKGIEAGLSTFEKSIETGRETTGAVREVINDVKIPDIANAVGKALQEAKLPRELASLVFTQLDDAKNDVVRIIAREVRDFLEATDLAGEIKAALTSLSFEVRTEVRFIPNEAGTGVRPDVRARGRVKRRATRDRRVARRDGELRGKDVETDTEGDAE
jgi:hypothetical protein